MVVIVFVCVHFGCDMFVMNASCNQFGLALCLYSLSRWLYLSQKATVFGYIRYSV